MLSGSDDVDADEFLGETFGSDTDFLSGALFSDSMCSVCSVLSNFS